MSPEKDQNQKRAKKPAGALKEFLNPHSMITPGACGAITMLITNTLASQFGAPPNYTGLGISCLFGLIVFAATATALWLRLVFWVLNSLIIFSIALGTNQAGVRVSKNLVAAHVLGPHLNAEEALRLNEARWEQAYAEHTGEWSYLLKGSFFANWLDGTVPRRKTLLMQVPKIDEWVALQTLNELGIRYKTEKPEFAKLLLENSAATAQTFERVSEIERALAKAKSEKENNEPR